MKKRYKSDIFKVLHEAAVAKFEIGAISEERMREADRACLIPDVPKVSTQAHTTATRGRRVPTAAGSASR
jgi:DNA-binding transcriptional regulator YiaG